MRVAMSRLRDVQEGVIEARGGRIVASMNEADHTIAVFREASAAALVALDLHDRIATEQFPPGIDLRLQAAVVVGEAILTGGSYSGAVVDQLLRLRSIAEPGSTITSERTAEQLVEWVGEQMSVVPITSRRDSLPAGMAICGITRPGAEATAAVRPLPASTRRCAAGHGRDKAPRT
jgi:class 3 adenylate cyclase